MMIEPDVVLFRADAAASFGTGHVMREMALAEGLADAGTICQFAMASSPPAILERLRNARFAVHMIDAEAGSAEDAKATATLARTLGAKALVLDGYHFDAAYRLRLRTSGCRILAFDDLATLPHLHADIVVNAAPEAHRLPYPRIAPGALLLLGSDHVMLRRDIRSAIASPRRAVADRTSLLMTLGGSDPLGLTAPCIERLAPAFPAGCRLTVVVGGGDPRAEAVAAAGARFADRVAVRHATLAMGALMAEAGLAVSAGGTTIGELAALQVPTLLVVVADNQVPAAAHTVRSGWCLALDGRAPDAPDRIAQNAVALWHDPARRSAMAEQARGLVDGRGVERVAAALLGKPRTT